MTITDISPDAEIVAVDDEAAARAAHATGLRALADAIEACPDVPVPFYGRLEPLTVHFLRDGDPIPAMARAASLFGGPWDSRIRDYTGSGGRAYFDLTGEYHGLHVKLTAYRDAACEMDGDGQWAARPAIAAALAAVDAETEAA
jgi:hypothetical protein